MAPTKPGERMLVWSLRPLQMKQSRPETACPDAVSDWVVFQVLALGVGGICAVALCESQGASFNGKLAADESLLSSSSRVRLPFLFSSSAPLSLRTSIPASPPSRLLLFLPVSFNPSHEYRRQQEAAEERAGRRLQPPLQQIVPPVPWKLNAQRAEGMEGRTAGHTVFALRSNESFDPRKAEQNRGAEVWEGKVSLCGREAVIVIPMNHSLSATAQYQTTHGRAERLHKFTAVGDSQQSEAVDLLSDGYASPSEPEQFLTGGRAGSCSLRCPLTKPGASAARRLRHASFQMLRVGRGHHGVGGPARCAEQLKPTWAQKSRRSSAGSASLTSPATTTSGYASNAIGLAAHPPQPRLKVHYTDVEELDGSFLKTAALTRCLSSFGTEINNQVLSGRSASQQSDRKTALINASESHPSTELLSSCVDPEQTGVLLRLVQSCPLSPREQLQGCEAAQKTCYDQYWKNGSSGSPAASSPGPLSLHTQLGAITYFAMRMSDIVGTDTMKVSEAADTVSSEKDNATKCEVSDQSQSSSNKKDAQPKNRFGANLAFVVGGRESRGVRQADNRSSNPGLSTNFLHLCYPEEQNDSSMGGAAGEGGEDAGGRGRERWAERFLGRKIITPEHESKHPSPPSLLEEVALRRGVCLSHQIFIVGVMGDVGNGVRSGRQVMPPDRATETRKDGLTLLPSASSPPRWDRWLLAALLLLTSALSLSPSPFLYLLPALFIPLRPHTAQLAGVAVRSQSQPSPPPLQPSPTPVLPDIEKTWADRVGPDSSLDPVGVSVALSSDSLVRSAENAALRSSSQLITVEQIGL
ncbi:unnamed protein product [Menidia menidia]|uniref:(Atlantic silverside) hypothetical protein n=1 Tax=Menidia menidia TaxID=238744 RepID=A0A8S4B8S9_9TELE|nr:unnamed protein product [Menidia menidia]